MARADSVYQEALEIRRALAEQNPAAYLPDVATDVEQSGVIYTADTQALARADSVYQEALEIRRALAEQNPAAYLPYVATTLNNLGALYYSTQALARADSVFQEALSTYRALAEQNPAAYLPDVAMTLNNLGVLYKNTQALARADSVYQEALEIRRALAEQNPAAYLPYVATTLNNLGALYYSTQALARADSVFQEALSTYRALAEQNPAAFNLDVCMTSLNVCLFYREVLETSKDLMYQSKALDLLKDVAKRLNLYSQENPAVSKYWEYHAYLTEYFETYDPNRISENPLIEQLTQQQKALEATDVFSEKVTIQLEIIQLLGTVLEADPANTQLSSYLAGQYGSLSWYHLFTRQFPQAEAAARKGLSLDDSATWIHTNLASALLFQDRFEEAEEIYQALRDQPYEGAPGQTYRHIFLEDLAALEEKGVTHPDVEKARALLGQ